ncbi:hypothetical protein NWE59_03465 [Mycoplasmopsis felis]|nr:hypothetical protein [Mycoplasmopsis felis]UWV78021.1 hypothetical protein NWE59_03465 [Mycoplasmopsis felis]
MLLHIYLLWSAEFTEKVTGFLAFGDKQLLAITDSVLNIVNSNFEMESSN